MSYHQWIVDTTYLRRNVDCMADGNAQVPEVLLERAKQTTLRRYSSSINHVMTSGILTPNEDRWSLEANGALFTVYALNAHAEGSDSSHEASQIPSSCQAKIQPHFQGTPQPHSKVAQPCLTFTPKDIVHHEVTHDSNEPHWTARLSTAQSHRKLASRDLKCRPLSLAATHPANYGLQSSQVIPATQIQMSSAKHATQQPTPPCSTLSSPSAPSPYDLVEDPPWRQYTDPMWQTSSDPNYWYNNCTILKCDRALESGNVISPTWMVGLPCGGMIEMAHHYPSLEAAEGKCAAGNTK